jgi:hypothetical protein
MTTGVVTGNGTLSYSGSVATIQPSGSTAYVIHNIAVANAANIIITDGSNPVIIDTSSGAQWWSNTFISIDNSVYLSIESLTASGTNMTYHWDGYQVA